MLDEPVASLDPLARREFLQTLMEVVAGHGVTVVLSSHLVADLERVCDYLVVLAASQVQLAGDVDALLASHRRLSGPRREPSSLPAGFEVVEASHTDRQSVLLVRTDEPILDPAWTVTPVTMDDLVLAYMSQARDATPRRQRARPDWRPCDDPLHVAPGTNANGAGLRRARDRCHRAGGERRAPRPCLRHRHRHLRGARRL